MQWDERYTEVAIYIHNDNNYYDSSDIDDTEL